MGDTYTYSTKTVHEHRAPTDASVKLLREMESKAEGQIRLAMPVEFNEFKGTVFVFQDMMNLGSKFGIKYQINGVDHEFMIKIPWQGLYQGATKTEEVLNSIHKQFSEHLASTLLSGLTDQMYTSLRKEGFFQR